MTPLHRQSGPKPSSSLISGPATARVIINSSCSADRNSAPAAVLVVVRCSLAAPEAMRSANCDRSLDEIWRLLVAARPPCAAQRHSRRFYYGVLDRDRGQWHPQRLQYATGSSAEVIDCQPALVLPAAPCSRADSPTSGQVLLHLQAESQPLVNIASFCSRWPRRLAASVFLDRVRLVQCVHTPTHAQITPHNTCCHWLITDGRLAST